MDVAALRQLEESMNREGSCSRNLTWTIHACVFSPWWWPSVSLAFASPPAGRVMDLTGVWSGVDGER